MKNVRPPAKARLGSRLAAAGLFALLLSAGAARADDGPVLGNGGDVYRIAAGRYEALFTGGDEVPADSHVLRLQVRRSDGAVERHLVPGSEPQDPDLTPSLFFDGATNRLYVVWSSHFDSTLTRINLASFDGQEWSDTIEVSGSIFGAKSDPRLVVTHDRFELAANKAGQRHVRTILHVVWSENTRRGEKVMYAPVVLVDGELASPWRRVHRLNDYVSPELKEAPFTEEAPTRLLTTPTIASGAEPNSVVIGFADKETGALVQLEIAAPAVELSELADNLVGFLESSNLCDRIASGERDAIASVAEEARIHIVVGGRRIRRNVLSALAEEVKGAVIARALPTCAEGGMTALASEARIHIVVGGARAQEDDLLKRPTDGNTHLLLAAAEPRGNGFIQHLARLQVQSERVAPKIGAGKPTIFVSPKGTGAVVAWEDGASLSWVESDGESGEWSESYTLRIGANLSRSSAYAMLERRARSLK